ncbi:MAG: FGGY-family carbohydrate kinase [Spirochaetota bacterium]
MGSEKVYFLGLDFGTESIRGALFDPEGKMVYTTFREYKTYFSHPGWAEQKPDEWWGCFLEVVKDIVQNSGISTEQILSMAADTTSCTVLALDENFNPLRNAIIWMDVRSFNQADHIAGSGMDALKYNGFGRVSAEWMPSKAMWMKENEPRVYHKARYICEFQDWVNYRLTGEYTGSINNVTVRWYYNSREGGWPQQFYQKIGLEDVIQKFPSNILELGRPIGKIRPQLADATGLSRGTLVVQGGADAYVGVLGVGAVKPGRLAFITGSSHLMLGHTEKGFYKNGIFGAFPDCVMPGLYVVEGAQISTGSVLKWFKEKFISQEYYREAEKNNLAIYEYMNRMAEKIRIGSEGLIVLNYWQGNRNPLVDSQARGVIWGLSLKHTPVHIYRAIMEAVSYGTEHIMRYFRDAGFETREVYACGGATESELWMQIQSDVIGTPIYLTREPNAPLLGDAILASYGAGYYRSITEAASKMVKVRKKITPNPENTRAYTYYVDKYIQTYPRMKDLMHDMLKHETG